VEARAAATAVAAADELSTRGVVQSVGDLKSSIGKMLGDLSDRLEEQVARYVQIQRAIVAKEQELKEIYEIQRSASTLTALIESHERQRAQLESDLSATKDRLQHEIELTRAHWEQEKKQRDAEARERDAAEAKRREREKEEYRYAFAREQQQAKDQFADETARAGKELAERKAQAEKELAERERAVKAREEEAAALRQRVESFPKELEAAVAKAVKETTTRLQQESLSREEIFKREFAGEKNVFTTRITSLEQTVKEQADQIAKLLQQAEKAYGHVQEIAVRAIEGSGSAKQLANLQQLLADQGRKGAGER
jgi:chromosome segregation ATPase